MCYSKRVLEAYARKIYADYKIPIPIESIIEKKYGLSLEYQILSKDLSILGQTVFEDGHVAVYNPDTGQMKSLCVKAGTILVDIRLSDDPRKVGRYRFTLAHELAHWILHQSIFKTANRTAALRTLQPWTPIEWEANYLSAATLMPYGGVKSSYYHHQSDNPSKMISKMADIFVVSKEAMSNRLSELGLCR